MKNFLKRLTASAAALLLLTGAASAQMLIPGGCAAGIKLYTQGLMVTGFEEESAAKDAGIKKGDIILAIDNVDFTVMKKENEAVSKMSTIVSGKKVGQTIKIKLLSSGKEKTLNVVLGKMPEESSINQNQQLQEMPKNMRRGRGQQRMPEGMPFPFFGEP